LEQRFLRMTRDALESFDHLVMGAWSVLTGEHKLSTRADDAGATAAELDELLKEVWWTAGGSNS
jgi:hypothetical protein